ncbi:SusE domain-containing protein [Niabella drilacis]|uniref:SusE outer membrane protein n=1 Tax=Niabella drilacis (strain DSM 25811 / CCM 8410 / CCUG 62505 / LMG 26954 / E90) TaxID=1285928 RepID=A0A1G6PYQ6_NIADE|nr:SusE domain-containing protein [Niabella drilacis]SDC85340.1 SusE outer membrane protein [Niabella drilacis]
MKQIYFLMTVLVAFLTLFSACKKDEHQVVFEGGTAPVLSASSTSAIVLLSENKTNDAIRFNWTNPDYQFNTGISSQDVTYTLQVDTAGQGFKGRVSERAVTNDLATTLTVAELNKMVLDLGVAPETERVVEFRIKSTISGTAALYSNVVPVKTTPYADVKYPVPAKLFIVGNATPGGWNNPVPADQQFTLADATNFEITIPLTAGGSYLFIPVNGSWGAKYGADGDSGSNNPAGDNFKPEGGDMIAPSVSGTYKITVDFKTGKFTVTKI